jgi:glycosyltransferase involved in cell wall biosynthesis
VLKECIKNDFSIDLSPWLNGQQKPLENIEHTDGLHFPMVAGRIITCTTEYNDKEESLPFRRTNTGLECTLQENDLLVRQENKHTWESSARLIAPIDEIIPTRPELSDQPMVLVVMPFLAVGGAERVTLEVMRQLKDRLRFSVVTFEEHDPALGTTADGFRQITPFVYTIPDFALETQYTSFMKYLLKRLKPSTIYIANGTSWIYDHLKEIKDLYPVLRIVDQVYDAHIGWINRYDFPVTLQTDGHIGVNDQICQAYIQKGAEPEQVYLIENGVDPYELNPDDYSGDRISKVKKKLGLYPDKKIVTFASRLHTQKRPMDFIELARRFSSDPTVEFLMVGNGPLANPVNEQIHKLGLKNVRRFEFYRPISDILAISDVLVLPSEFEGMPMIVIEAQAMGKPVVVTDVGNNREIIERTGGGIVVSRIGDISALLQAVKEMLAAPPDPGQLRRLTLSHFDLKSVAQKYLNALLGDGSSENETSLQSN